eukprot:m.187705 g.187705  ORF g.187705 m.187705 type:complete len:1009 (+) comp13627_c0_seq6:580-3606(+)
MHIKSQVKKSAQKEFDIAVSQAKVALRMSFGERMLRWLCFGKNEPLQPHTSRDRHSKTEVMEEQPSRVAKKQKVKRCRSAFTYFCMHEREHNKDITNLPSFASVVQTLSPKWREMGDEEKEPFVRLAIEDKKRYVNDLQGVSDKNLSKFARKLKRDPNKPKKPLSGYILFCKTFREEVKKITSSAPEVFKVLSQRWKALSEDERAQYNKSARAAMETYKRDLAKYESQRLVSQGEECLRQLEENIMAIKSENIDGHECSSPTNASSTFMDGYPDMKLNGHVMFTLHFLQSLSSEDMEKTSEEKGDMILSAWDSVPPEEKKQWDQKAAHARRKNTKAKRSFVEAQVKSVADGYRISLDRTSLSKTTESSKMDCEGEDLNAHENVCAICRVEGELLCCDGECLRSFHLSCLGLSDTPQGEFICDECTVGVPWCSICSTPSTNLMHCASKGCSKVFHKDCVSSFPHSSVQGNGSILCPNHECAQCENMESSMFPLVSCIRCPTSYHSCCIPAGVGPLEQELLVCPHHIDDHAHGNVSFCLVCGDGGDLFCCDSCPGAFHSDCIRSTIHLTGDPSTSDVWKCYDCVAGVKCINGDVVWLKLGNHRYWPALSVEDSSLPLAVQQRKPKGESLSFCVKFFGTGDYTWTSHMRVIKWSLNDEKGYFAKTGKQKPSFLQALKDAAVAYNTVKADREQLMVALRGRVDTKPPLFQRLRTNMYTIPRMRLDVAEECGCVEECDDNCLNKLLSVECDPKKCTTGDKCSNRRIQQRKYPKLVPFLTPNRGWGLKAGEDIAQGRFVIEYVGEVIGEEECKRRLAENEKNKNHSFYILSLCRGVYVDARLKANLARFINHSCDPNCSIQKWNVLGEIKVGIFAKMDIKKGTELTFDYQLDSLGSANKTVCHCGGDNCRGFIQKSSGGGKKLKNVVKDKSTTKKPKRAKKPKIAKGKKELKQVEVIESNDASDDVCAVCGLEGTLICCDFKDCPLVYHVGCLEGDRSAVDPMAVDVWHCPRHK